MYTSLVLAAFTLHHMHNNILLMLSLETSETWKERRSVVSKSKIIDSSLVLLLHIMHGLEYVNSMIVIILIG